MKPPSIVTPDERSEDPGFRKGALTSGGTPDRRFPRLPG